MLTLTLVLATSLLGAAPAKFADLFEPCDYRYGRKQEQLLKCRLFTPCDLDAAKQYPMLVWLFHAGDLGPEFIQFALPDLVTCPEKYPFYILTIQWPTTDSGWFTSVGADTLYDADAALIYQIVQKNIREHPAVDERRVCVSGASRGGDRCWRVAARCPELFSAVAPMAGGGEDVARAANLAKVPIWAFHNTQDTVPPPDGDKRIAAAVAAIGGNMHLTLLPTGGHDCWTAAFQTHDVLAWMLAQHRGALCWIPPGYHLWQWWHILTLPCALLLLIRLAWYVEQRRRHKVIPNAGQSELEITDDDFVIGPIQSEYDPLSTEALISRGAAP